MKKKPEEVPTKKKVPKIEPNTKATAKANDGATKAATVKTTKGKAKSVATTIYKPNTVEFLPIFPGCDKYSTNNERAICFQEKVQRMVLRRFNNGLGDELGLSGKQTIFLYFEINENGLVSNIKAR
ncbi:hypothetical protein [Aquimarina agarivorans]|uniref:hypothetical protein n=1 Tax=Aquimarina agarivorans TaxID=980584 RepID=UPI000248E62A|nr:hypothetical protein [Aquimarina agarivorans]